MKVKRLILSFFILLSTVSLSALNDVNIIDIVMLINDNKYTKAKPLAQKLVKQQPDNDAAWYYLGQCHWAEGDYEKAMNCFREAINLDPKNDAYYLILYNALSAFKGFEDQTDSLALEMINRFPSKYNTPYTLALLGESEMNNSKDSLAQVHLQQALSIDPGYAPAAFALAELYRTQGNMSAYFITIPTYLTSNYYPTEDKTKYLWEVLRMADGQSWRIYGRRLDALVDTLLVTYPKDSLCIKLAGEWDIYTGRPEAATIVCVMSGCGVNGCTAKTASALMFLIIARSVEKTSDFILLPKTKMPLHSLITSGTFIIDFLKVPSNESGNCFIAILLS